jgi:hypothetical protein
MPPTRTACGGHRLTCRRPPAEDPCVPDDARHPGILALVARRDRMGAALAHLREAGMPVDVVHDAAGARGSFFASGGQDCLVIGPEVQPALATAVAATLQAVDPGLSVANFGPPLGVGARSTRVARLHGFHPASRAGIGALLRFLRALERRQLPPQP